MRIVVVDDNRIMRQVIAGYLIKTGHEIVGEAENGRDGIALCREIKPDLVTLDWAMNQINGDEAARVIHRENLARSILFITSQGQAVVKETADEIGARFIKKPFREQQLGKIVEEIANESSEPSSHGDQDGDNQRAQ